MISIEAKELLSELHQWCLAERDKGNRVKASKIKRAYDRICMKNGVKPLF